MLLTFEAGRMMFIWALLLESSREAARIAILASSTTTTPIVNSALDLTSWFGVTASNVTVYDNGVPVSGAFTRHRGDAISVNITYTYHVFIAQAIGSDGLQLPFTTLTIPVQTQMRAEG
jgi:hypothetical protein